MTIMTDKDWGAMQHFAPEEFACKCAVHRGGHHQRMTVAFMKCLSIIRVEYGFPIVPSSGYRCKNHADESWKRMPGPHNLGEAVDFVIFGFQLPILMEKLYDRRLISKQIQVTGTCIRGVGLRQHGDLDTRYIHLDCCQSKPYRPRPHLWTYP